MHDGGVGKALDDRELGTYGRLKPEAFSHRGAPRAAADHDRLPAGDLESCPGSCTAGLTSSARDSSMTQCWLRGQQLIRGSTRPCPPSVSLWLRSTQGQLHEALLLSSPQSLDGAPPRPPLLSAQPQIPSKAPLRGSAWLPEPTERPLEGVS